jgi:DUF2934 family protein
LGLSDLREKLAMPKAKPAPASEDKVRARAHEIWEHAGRPDGHHLTHWHQAIAELSGRGAGKPRPAAAKSAKPAAAPKPAKAAAKPAKAKAKPAAKSKPAGKPAAQNRRGASAR